MNLDCQNKLLHVLILSTMRTILHCGIKSNPSFALKSMFGGYDELMEPVCNTFTAKEPFNQLGGYPYLTNRSKNERSRTENV